MGNKPKIAGRAIELLLVEDNRGDEAFMREVLKEAGFPIHLNVARDGREALAFLERQGSFSQAPQPDVILLDLNLPQKNGMEVLIEIKLNYRLEHIPVFILTGSQADLDMRSAYRLKADYYIVKPLDMDHFTELVEYLRSLWIKTFRAIGVHNKEKKEEKFKK